jgi:hypothetical protein
VKIFYNCTDYIKKIEKAQDCSKQVVECDSKGARRRRGWVVCESSISSPFQGRFFHVPMGDIKGTNFSFGCAIAQVVSRRIPTLAAQVRAQVRSCGICGGQSGTGSGFLWVLWFPLPILIPLTAPHSSSSSIIWDWYNRPNSGWCAKWTQSNPTPRNKVFVSFIFILCCFLFIIYTILSQSLLSFSLGSFAWWIPTSSYPHPPYHLHTVAYRPIAKWWLCNQWLLLGNGHNQHTTIEQCSLLSAPFWFLGNGSVNTFPWQRILTQQYSYCWKRCFLLGPCKGFIRKTVGATQSVESSVLYGRLWRKELVIRVLTWKSGCEEKTLCV